ncbi:MAG: DUF4258 domain-containing protein [Desulfococcaceae bacterium]
MDESQAKETLRNIARFGTVGTAKHCRKRMKERNVVMDDILNVLIWGSAEETEKTDSGTWKLAVKGRDMEEDELTCVAELIASANAVYVTVF